MIMVNRLGAEGAANRLSADQPLGIQAASHYSLLISQYYVHGKKSVIGKMTPFMWFLQFFG